MGEDRQERDVVGDADSPVLSKVRVVTDGSVLFQWTRRAATAVVESRLGSGGTWLQRTAEQSMLYRWLTREPEPDVTVLTPRETYTLGPTLELLDMLLERFAPYWHSSLLKRLTLTIERSVQWGAETRFGEFLRGVFEPPKSSSETNDSTSENTNDAMMGGEVASESDR